MNNYRNISKLLSLVLRHNPRKIGIELDKNGWADVAELITAVKSKGHGYLTLDILKEVVHTNDKQRFAFNEGFTKIRANQGHSISVDVELKETTPPNVLYHGTATRFIEAIREDGLRPQSRLYVHLSADEETAVEVGRRHGSPVVLIVKAAEMQAAGHKFYLAENGVWLTETVEPKYIKEESYGQLF